MRIHSSFLEKFSIQLFTNSNVVPSVLRAHGLSRILGVLLHTVRLTLVKEGLCREVAGGGGFSKSNARSAGSGLHPAASTAPGLTRLGVPLHVHASHRLIRSQRSAPLLLDLKYALAHLPCARAFTAAEGDGGELARAPDGQHGLLRNWLRVVSWLQHAHPHERVPPGLPHAESEAVHWIKTNLLEADATALAGLLCRALVEAAEAAEAPRGAAAADARTLVVELWAALRTWLAAAARVEVRTAAGAPAAADAPRGGGAAGAASGGTGGPHAMATIDTAASTAQPGRADLAASLAPAWRCGEAGGMWVSYNLPLHRALALALQCAQMLGVDCKSVLLEGAEQDAARVLRGPTSLAVLDDGTSARLVALPAPDAQARAATVASLLRSPDAVAEVLGMLIEHPLRLQAAHAQLGAGWWNRSSRSAWAADQFYRCHLFRESGWSADMHLIQTVGAAVGAHRLVGSAAARFGLAEFLCAGGEPPEGQEAEHTAALSEELLTFCLLVIKDWRAVATSEACARAALRYALVHRLALGPAAHSALSLALPPSLTEHASLDEVLAAVSERDRDKGARRHSHGGAQGGAPDGGGGGGRSASKYTLRLECWAEVDSTYPFYSAEEATEAAEQAEKLFKSARIPARLRLPSLAAARARTESASILGMLTCRPLLSIAARVLALAAAAASPSAAGAGAPRVSPGGAQRAIDALALALEAAVGDVAAPGATIAADGAAPGAASASTAASRPPLAADAQRLLRAICSPDDGAPPGGDEPAPASPSAGDASAAAAAAAAGAQAGTALLSLVRLARCAPNSPMSTVAPAAHALLQRLSSASALCRETLRALTEQQQRVGGPTPPRTSEADGRRAEARARKEAMMRKFKLQQAAFAQDTAADASAAAAAVAAPPAAEMDVDTMPRRGTPRGVRAPLAGAPASAAHNALLRSRGGPSPLLDALTRQPADGGAGSAFASSRDGAAASCASCAELYRDILDADDARCVLCHEDDPSRLLGLVALASRSNVLGAAARARKADSATSVSAPAAESAAPAAAPAAESAKVRRSKRTAAACAPQAGAPAAAEAPADATPQPAHKRRHLARPGAPAAADGSGAGPSGAPLTPTAGGGRAQAERQTATSVGGATPALQGGGNAARRGAAASEHRGGPTPLRRQGADAQSSSDDDDDEDYDPLDPMVLDAGGEDGRRADALAGGDEGSELDGSELDSDDSDDDTDMSDADELLGVAEGTEDDFDSDDGGTPHYATSHNHELEVCARVRTRATLAAPCMLLPRRGGAGGRVARGGSRGGGEDG